MVATMPQRPLAVVPPPFCCRKYRKVSQRHLADKNILNRGLRLATCGGKRQFYNPLGLIELSIRTCTYALLTYRAIYLHKMEDNL
jgi:hypothetical protein